MINLTTENVRTAYPEVLRIMRENAVERNSRNGRVVQLRDGLSVTYTDPRQRVLLDARRDANPFFHVVEAMWMLDGRNDVDSLTPYVKRMAEFSDDGYTLNGAYGHRWRRYFGKDQLKSVVERLRKNPDDRRQVIQMWSIYDLGSNSKDLPCNTQCTVQVGPTGALDLFVFNRSNDVVWGMLGANAVHFSFLHEYLADGVGVPVGWMTQVSANPHLYLDRHADLIKPENIAPAGKETYKTCSVTYEDDAGLFRTLVLKPMREAHRLHRAGQHKTAISACAEIYDEGWRKASEEWLVRRARTSD